MARGQAPDPELSVLISHSSVAPFVQQAARALHEAGNLDRFVTTLRYDPNSRPQRCAIRMARAAGVDLEGLLQRRTITELPSSKVESHPLGEIIRLASSRFDHSGRLTDLVWERTEPAFDRLVARRVRREHTAVYGFEYCSLATFARARELGVRVAYDMPAPEPRFVQGLLDAEIAHFPELDTSYHRHTTKREERRIARRRAEWDAADLVIAASRFTRDSFAQGGFDTTKVQIVPYGAPPPISQADLSRKTDDEAAPLRLLWAGTFSIRKGAHYLLEAWRKNRLARHIRLTVCGTVALPPRLLEPMPEHIEFTGPLPKAQLMARYDSADVLIFPTLCDGFGMVVTEAWSRGLPVIITDHAGANDLLQPNRNGILIPAGDADAIASALNWCLDHRAELRDMREAALATAAGWQWSDYRRSLAVTLRQAGMFGRT